MLQTGVLVEVFGLPSTIRTCDLRLRRALLYPAELWADICKSISCKQLRMQECRIGPLLVPEVHDGITTEAKWSLPSPH